MISVLRNGKFQYTEELQFGDIIVPPRPHSKAKYINNRWLVDADTIINTANSEEAIIFLNSTDWKVIRHRDQLALGVETSLTTEEFQELLRQRQNAREQIMEGK
jgi:hypothetical protein